MEIEEHHHEDLKHAVHEESMCNLVHEINTKYQVSNLLCCCLRFINDVYASTNLMQMLATFMGEQGKERDISTPLLERYLC
jgi:hypothetical protein